MPHEPLRILVADDHPLMRDGVRALLEAEGDMAVVGEAATSEQAVLLHATLRPDVLLLDLKMPAAGGLAAARSILEAEESARILILTTLDGDEDIHRALALGARGYVLKEEARTEVTRAIRGVLAGKRVVGTIAAQRLAEHVPRVPLTSRELDVLTLMARGLSNKEVGAETGCTEGTVKVHVSHILGKLGASDRTDAVTIALRRGIIHLWR